MPNIFSIKIDKIYSREKKILKIFNFYLLDYFKSHIVKKIKK
jgi:hypothetical protein